MISNNSSLQAARSSAATPASSRGRRPADGRRSAKSKPLVEASSKAIAMSAFLLAARNAVYATGKRKNSIARVWLAPGSGKMLINRRFRADQYFPQPSTVTSMLEPLVSTGCANNYDVWCTVTGGGCSGQSGAIRLGIARALLVIDPALRKALRSADLLTRDSRVVERKKPGCSGARKKFQFSKR